MSAPFEVPFSSDLTSTQPSSSDGIPSLTGNSDPFAVDSSWHVPLKHSNCFFNNRLPPVVAIGFEVLGSMHGGSGLLSSDLFHADTDRTPYHAAKDMADDLKEGSKNENHDKEQNDTGHRVSSCR